MNVHGLCVAILGPDGVGKSSLIAGLRTTYPRPITVVKMSGSARAPVRGPAATRWLVRTVRTARVLLASRLAVSRGRLLVWDRHPLEDRFTSIEGRLVLGRGRGWLARLAPSPHILVVLDAPGEVLHARRRGESPDQLERLRQIYLRLAGERPAVVIDASLPPDEVRDGVVASLLRFEADHHPPADDPDPAS